MALLRRVAHAMPFARRLYRVIRDSYLRYRLRDVDIETIFTDIYCGHQFGGRHSASGPGSELDQTGVIVREIPRLCGELAVSTMLDIPCGDFHWMSTVDLSGIEYVGADVVKQLVAENARKYRRTGVAFRQLNIRRDALPKVDLVLCRDCLVHFSFEDAFAAIDNICRSRSEYLLTTTFVSRTSNRDIVTGQWRTINLEIPPFDFPEPVRIICEACTEVEGEYRDKALGLWRVEDLRARAR